jgi:uncharacterized membrane protein
VGLVIVSVAAWLRFHNLGFQALWIDEYATLLVASHPFSRIPAAALEGNAFAPPVYFWVARAFAQVFGDTETALRLPSAIAGTLTVGVFWRLIRAAGGWNLAALTGAALLAANPLHIWYSQEARPYALMVFLGVWSLVVLFRAYRTNAIIDWTAYAVLTALAILTHLAGVTFPLVVVLWEFTSRRGFGRRKALAAALCGVAIPVVPFLVALVTSVEPGTTGSSPRAITGLEIPYTLLTFVGGFSLGPSVRELQDYGWRAAVATSAPQLVLAAIGLVVAAFLSARVGLRRPSIIFVVLVATPIALAFGGAAFSGKAYTVRYALPGVIGLLGLMGLGLGSLRSPLRWSATAYLLLLFGLADWQWFHSPRYWKEDSRLVVTCLRSVLPPGALVTVAPNYMASILGHYSMKAGGDLKFDPLPENASAVGRSNSQALLLTRLHHVAGWSEIARTFESASKGRVTEQEVGGYRLYLKGNLTPSTCAAGDL